MVSKELPMKPPRIVDFLALSVDKSERQLQREHFGRVAAELWDAFAEDGYVYIKNHGITDAEIERVFAVGDSFFELPSAVKDKYICRKDDDNKHGYIPIDGERLSYNEMLESGKSSILNEKKKRVEHRESFNITTTKSSILHTLNSTLPETDCPGFTATVDVFYRRCSLLALRVLRAIAIALKLEDEHYFTNTHLPMDIIGNYSLLRLLNYPPITAEEAHENSTVRCGEHSDYGSMTLLIQDGTGGLEARTRSGEHVQIKPIPGTVLVNIANILEYMTSGQLLSVKHRVLVKESESAKRRRAIAFFVHPVHETLVKRLNGPEETNVEVETAQEFAGKHSEVAYLV